MRQSRQKPGAAARVAQGRREAFPDKAVLMIGLFADEGDPLRHWPNADLPAVIAGLLGIIVFNEVPREGEGWSLVCKFERPPSAQGDRSRMSDISCRMRRLI